MSWWTRWCDAPSKLRGIACALDCCALQSLPEPEVPGSEWEALQRYLMSGRRTITGHASLADGVAVGLPEMPDEFLVTCPFCGEQVEIYVEPDVHGSFVQDCEVCCNPWRVRVSGRDDDRVVHVTRADGSE
jgi:Cysteine-rich CPXCG